MNSKSPHLPFSVLCSYATECGLGIYAVSETTNLPESGQCLVDWQRAGFAADMGYMQRIQPDRSNVGALLPAANSVISLAVFYSQQVPPAWQVGYGKVARYAWGLDYHQVLKNRVGQLAGQLFGLFGDKLEFKVWSDAVPLLERAFAAQAGLGAFGKNNMLIRPGQGSLFFLAEIVSNLIITELPAKQTFKNICGSCTRCLSGCPTEALIRPYALDARRCISYLSIEKRGSLEVWEREALGSWVFGCDICQDVCPYNYAALKRGQTANFAEFNPENGPGPLLDLAGVLALADDAAFKQRFADTAIMRTKRGGLLRNACCVAANTGATGLLGKLSQLAEADQSEVVRQHALWAAINLIGTLPANTKGSEESVAAKQRLLASANSDVSAIVRDEARRIAYSL